MTLVRTRPSHLIFKSNLINCGNSTKVFLNFILKKFKLFFKSKLKNYYFFHFLLFFIFNNLNLIKENSKNHFILINFAGLRPEVVPEQGVPRIGRKRQPAAGVEPPPHRAHPNLHGAQCCCEGVGLVCGGNEIFF